MASKRKRTKVGKTRMIAAIEANAGIVAAIARQLNVTRQTVYNTVDKFGLRDMLADERDNIHDIAEGNVYQAVMAGDLDMSKFVLTSMPTSPRKSRWSSRQDVAATVQGFAVSEDTLKRLQDMGVSVGDVAADFERMIQAMHAEAMVGNGGQ